jgi:hypothetical protein
MTRKELDYKNIDKDVNFFNNYLIKMIYHIHMLVEIMIEI